MGLEFDDEFGEVRSIHQRSLDAEDGVGPEWAQGEAQGDGVGLVEEFHFAFEEAAVVEGAHGVGGGFVVEGDETERLAVGKFAEGRILSDRRLR